MNYNDFFESALSAAYKKAPMTDDDTFMRIVKERAKKMKKNDNVKQMHFTEITPEYAEPKKSHKALNVFAGVAGTAAVLTGAVFGLKFLNEHGGLKGPDVQGAGAGYHEDSEPAQSAAVPEETEPAVTEENKGEETRLACAPSGIDERYFKETDASFNFGDIQAHISGYSYDGLMLIVKYELTYPEEIADYPSNIPTLIDRREATGELPFWNNPRYSRYTAFDGNKVEIERYILNRNLENSFDTLWIDESLDPAERLNKAKADADSDELIFTVHRTVTDNPVIASDVSEYTLPDGTCIYPNNVFISAYGIFIDFEHIDLPAWEKLCSNMETLPITLIMSDGSEIFVTGGSKMGLCSDHDDSINYVGGLFDETIDTRNVKSVNIFGEPFVSFEKTTSFDIVFNFDDSPISGDFEFLYYIDGELQNDLTETRSLSEIDKLHWEVSGIGVHTYKVDIVSLEKGSSGTLFEATVDFSKEEPEKDFHESFNGKIFKQLVEQGDTPEFPIAISNGNGMYGEYLDTPLTGDGAWELVKERGDIDFDYNLPYDKSLFTFTGAAFVIDYADCDVKAIVGGTVEYAGWYIGWGQTILLHDENGHYWLYGHLGEISVAEGDKVESGERIGHTGTSGLTDHQLFAMRVG